MDGVLKNSPIIIRLIQSRWSVVHIFCCWQWWSTTFDDMKYFCELECGVCMWGAYRKKMLNGSIRVAVGLSVYTEQQNTTQPAPVMTAKTGNVA